MSGGANSKRRPVPHGREPEIGHDASAIAIFSADPSRHEEVAAWQTRIDAAAATFPRFVDSQVTPPVATGSDWAGVIIFASSEDLQTWLDSDVRQSLLVEGEQFGVVTTVPTIVLVEGQSPPPGIAVIMHRVAPDHEAAFTAAQADLLNASKVFPGFTSAVLVRPTSSDGEWVSATIFDSEANLQRWMKSSERAALLPELREQLSTEFVTYTRHTPFGSIVRFDGESAKVTPDWKTAMIVLLVLFPIVMLLTRFFGPAVEALGLNPGLATWLSNGVSVVLLTWVVMPWATKVFAWWLDPVEGAAMGPTIKGVVIIVILYAITLAVFLAFRSLQFWDYSS